MRDMKSEDTGKNEMTNGTAGQQEQSRTIVRKRGRN